MARQGIMLSTMTEEVLGRFRYIFYRRTGFTKDQRLIVHSLASLATYAKRGWAFDQQLKGGFKMVFQHYGLRASKQEYGKYDHILYIDIVPEKPRTSDDTRQNAYDVKKDVAVRVMKDIEEYLVTSGLAVEIQVEEVPADKTRPEIGAPGKAEKSGEEKPQELPVSSTPS